MMNEKEARINALSQLLAHSDYKALKAFEGHPSADWEEVKMKRQAWREEINALRASEEEDK